ncbi:MAG: hypothetical protein HFE86_04545 [Clostridiales bacterium]|nr:hypothetical protein [Clostridiales bacterium]
MQVIRKWNLAGAVFTLLAGPLLHFVYDWFGGVAAVFGAVNESTWEHLKLLFWPMFFFGVLEYLTYGRKTPGFLPLRVLSILVGMLTTTAFFYTYTGVLGYNFLAADIGVFIAGVVAAYLFSYRRLQSPGPWAGSALAGPFALLTAGTLAACFILFTYCPPHIGLFLDPVTGNYGLPSS